MTSEIIAFEGTTEGLGHYPLLWGAAAYRNGNKVYNAVTGFGMALETWEAKLKNRELCVTTTEVPIPIPVDALKIEGSQRDGQNLKYYVLSLRLDLLDRAPYQIQRHFPGWRGIAVIARGLTRGYYVFNSHKELSSWLYHLHAGTYELVSSVKTGNANGRRRSDGGHDGYDG